MNNRGNDEGQVRSLPLLVSRLAPYTTMAKKRTPIFDDRVKLYPYVGISEAATIFGVGKRTLDSMLADGLAPRLPFDNTTKGRVFRLVDVYRAAYPDMPDELLYRFCIEYMENRHAKRVTRKQEGTAL